MRTRPYLADEITFIIIINKYESAVKGWERVRTVYHPEDPNPTQPTHGRNKLENSKSQKERAE